MQRIDVYSPSLERIGAIYGWLSLVWTDSYNEGGSFQLEAVPSADLRELLAPDNFVRYSEAMTMKVITSVQIESDEMIINGKEAAYLLNSRITTAVTSAGVAETQLRAAIEKYASGLTAVDPGESAGLEQEFDTDYAPDTLWSIVQQACYAADIGYRLDFDAASKKLVAEFYAPEENANAVYSPQYGNIANVSYTQSHINYKNVCVVLGGSADEGYTVKATVGDTEAADYNRREMVITASENFEQAGKEELAKQADIETVDCTINGGQLGDIVTIRLPEIGVSVKKRITQIQITAQGGSTEKTYTVGSIIKGVS